MNWRPFPLLAVLVLVAACGASTSGGTASPSASQAAGGLPQDAVVTYAFYDSSVPPQYHRSVSLIATAEEARIVIDSYGDVLADETVPMPAATWELLGSTLGLVEGLDIVESEQGCTGGTSVDLTIVAAGTTALALAPQFCGGTNEAAEVAINEWITPVRGLFPPTDVLAPEQP